VNAFGGAEAGFGGAVGSIRNAVAPGAGGVQEDFGFELAGFAGFGGFDLEGDDAIAFAAGVEASVCDDAGPATSTFAVTVSPPARVSVYAQPVPLPCDAW